MKTLLHPLLVLLPILSCFLPVTQAQTDNNYLIQALDAAMAMKANFDYNAVYYREYATYESMTMTEELLKLVKEAVARSSTEDHGESIRTCTHEAATLANGLIKHILDHLEVIQDAALVYYKIILSELMDSNVFTKDFDLFYYEFNLKLNENYEYLNDILLQNVLDALFDLLDGKKVIYSKLDECLNAI